MILKVDRGLDHIAKGVQEVEVAVALIFVDDEFVRCCGRRPARRREPLAVPVSSKTLIINGTAP